METLLDLRVRESGNDVRLLLERKTSLAGHSHTKILNLLFREFTLGRVDAEAEEAEAVENLVDMSRGVTLIMSSTYTKQWGISLRIWSIILKPNDILIHSKRPKGVITAVIGMSPLVIGT